MKGAERAVAAGIDHFTVTVSASAAYNEKNVRMTIDESVAEVGGHPQACSVPTRGSKRLCRARSARRTRATWHRATLLTLGGATQRRLGATALTYADTTGMATPRRITELVAVTGPRVGLHLHETRGTAMVNAYAALDLGVRDFDTSIGGLGGSPFAAGAGGNLATEDFVHLLDDIGLRSGIDLDRLLEVSARLAELVGRPLPSKVANAGPRCALLLGAPPARLRRRPSCRGARTATGS